MSDTYDLVISSAFSQTMSRGKVTEKKSSHPIKLHRSHQENLFVKCKPHFYTEKL